MCIWYTWPRWRLTALFQLFPSIASKTFFDEAVIINCWSDTTRRKCDRKGKGKEAVGDKTLIY